MVHRVFRIAGSRASRSLTPAPPIGDDVPAYLKKYSTQQTQYLEEGDMTQHGLPGRKVNRRTVLKAGAAAAGALQFPFINFARAAETVKIGLDNPLTGTYAAVGTNEKIGCELAVEQINAKGGILGRPAELLVEDSTSGESGTAVQKALKLIERDKVNFLLGNVN